MKNILVNQVMRQRGLANRIRHCKDKVRADVNEDKQFLARHPDWKRDGRKSVPDFTHMVNQIKKAFDEEVNFYEQRRAKLASK